MERELDGRHVVVTGSGGALGGAVVALLVERGAICHLPLRRPDEGSRLPESCHVVTGVDLADEAAISLFYAQLPSLWASIHCAGGFAAAPIVDTTLDSWSSLWTRNATSCFLCCREAVRAIRRSGGAGGRLVNVAARAALEPGAGAGMAAYAASKGAIGTLTLALARELADERIWVNAIAPSILDTPANRRAMPGADRSRWAKLPDVADWIALLASPRNATTTGSILPT
jgi:NAD(P)-dependent dehydrogenase (short-subunit alcohol dehydrogenase family)